jgi:hypothetical protein
MSNGMIHCRVTAGVTRRYNPQQTNTCLDTERYDRGWNR